MLLVGCTEPHILERISLATLIGYDLTGEDELTTTAVMRQINPDLESKTLIQSTTSSTSKGGRKKIELATSKEITTGQLRVVLFGEELAKYGLDYRLRTIMMSSEISNAIYLAMVEGDLKSFLESDYKDIPNLGQHIFQLIEHNIEQQNAVSSTVHEISRDDFSRVASYALPILKKEKDDIKISGIALFHKGKIVGTLSAKDAFYIQMVRDNSDNGTMELNLPITTLGDHSLSSSKYLSVALDSIRSKRRITVVDQTLPEFNLTIHLDCRLYEIISNVNIDEAEIIQKLEKEINKKLESEIKRVIQYSQEVNSDIFRFGEYYEAQVRNANMDVEKWSEMYPEMKVNVTVKAKILRDGVFQ